MTVVFVPTVAMSYSRSDKAVTALLHRTCHSSNSALLLLSLLACSPHVRIHSFAAFLDFDRSLYHFRRVFSAAFTAAFS